ncbi:iodotyrosine deiodinase 1-like [Acanthaster planci]|uniref:Iodotyrosine deiodinase 1-like n=1 Tax=Acanthaster planci TaxID=133434 RepID=A0A8B7Z649_ACAPL|nr:iodotyrosine deiodinase 1-like [Acanthaster planci]
MALPLAPFFLTYWPQIVSAVLCFLIGTVYAKAFVTVPAASTSGDVKRDSSAVDDPQEPPSPPPSPSHDKAPRVPYSLPGFCDEEMVRRSNQFYREMDTRRSVRDISDKPVPLEVIENCIRMAGTAPSGAHMQPWTFAVLSNPQVKLEVRLIIEEEERMNYEKRMSAQWLHDLEKLRLTWSKPYLTRAPYIIVVFKQLFRVTEEGKKTTNYYQEISASIATGFLLAAVHNAGLVTVTTTPMNAGPRLRTLLERPISEKVLVLLPVGHPEDGATVPDLQRKALQEIMVLK